MCRHVSNTLSVTKQQRHWLLQRSSFISFVHFRLIYSLQPSIISQTWPQCFKPKLECFLLGKDCQLLWRVSIHYPDFTTVCSVPLFKVCRVIIGRTCIKLLFSRWQAGNIQELLSPAMCSCWNHYDEHLAFRWHGAATGPAELKWVIVKVLLAEEEKLQTPRTQKANSLYSREKPCNQTCADLTQHLIADGGEM